MKKVKIERIDPVKDLVDVWRLFKSSLVNSHWNHPSTKECHESDMQAYLNAYLLKNPAFHGVIARVNKRPVAVAFGNGNFHPFGAPDVYFFVHCVWVEKEFRGGNLAAELWAALHEDLKKHGFRFWEANVFDPLAQRLLKKSKAMRARKLSTRIGGMI